MQFEDVITALTNAREEGYGHAYLTIHWNDESLTWGMCGSQTYFPENESWNGEKHTYLSPALSHFDAHQGYVRATDEEVRDLARRWVSRLSQNVPPPVWERIYTPQSRV